MNYVLAGAFSSRINLNLREDKGYTYGARSGFSATRIPGPFTASAGVRADSTADSIVQFVNEITRYRENGITSEGCCWGDLPACCHLRPCCDDRQNAGAERLVLQDSEGGSDLVHEDLGLFPRSEVAACVKLVPVPDVRVALLGPAA